MADNPFADLIPGQSQGQDQNPFADLVPSQGDQEQAPDTSWGNKLSRFGRGALDAPIAIAQGASHLTGLGTETTDDWANQNAQREAELKAQAGIKPDETDWYGTAGSIAPSLAVPEFGIASKLGLGAKSLTGLAGRGAIGGAGFAAAQPVTNVTPDNGYWDQKASQTGTGALVGGAAGPAIGAIARVAKPALQEGAQTLMDAGVRLNPGQMLGGMSQRVENALESHPFAGQLIRNLRTQSGEDFQKATANKVLEPIGEKVDPKISVGPDLINHVEDKIGEKYNSVHPNIKLGVDKELETNFQNILSEAALDLPEERVKQLSKFIEGRVSDVIDKNGGTASGDVVQGITSKLGSKIRDYRVSTDPDQKVLGTYFADVRQAVGEAIERQNPDYAKDLSNANRSWQLYTKMRDAAGRQGTGPGQFSPTQLENAAKKGESAGTKAKGTSPLQDLASQGKNVVPSKVPDSGTPERMMLMGYHNLLGPASHYAAHSALGPGALVPGLAIAALYNPVGQELARRLIAGSPATRQAIRNQIERYAPTVASRLPLLSNSKQ